MAVDRVRLAGALAEIVADPSWTVELPQRLCGACNDALPVDGVGLTLMMHDQPDNRALLGASDERAERIEEVQFDLGEGPCVSASAAGRPMLVTDMQATSAAVRWPMFTREIASSGIGAVYAFPLQVGSIAIGVLDCYRSRPGPLTEIREVLLVADIITVALLNAMAGCGSMVDLIDMSWRSHAVVHQATGVLSAELGISVAEALVRLRAHAFRCSQSLEMAAGEVLAGRLKLSA